MLKDSKISSAEIAENNVKSAANRLVGTANENKNVFDKLTELLAKKINNLVDVLTDLTEEGGASQIGSAPIEKLVGTNVRDQIVEILDLVCDRYTKQETEALALQETNDLISDLSIDLDTGIITVTKKDGTTKEWDTALEKVPATFEFIDEEGEYFLKITNVDETSSKVNVTSLMNIFEFENSDEVSFNVSGDGNKKVVTASIRPQSIGIEKLSLSAISQLEEYSSSAQQSAIRAQNAKEETERLKNEVEGMYQETSSLSEQVEQDTNTTRDYYNEVAGMYDATRGYTERAEAAAREVENAISGGDMYKSIYDKNGDGIVDNAEALEGKTLTQVVGMAVESAKQNVLASDVGAYTISQTDEVIGNALASAKAYADGAESNAKTYADTKATTLMFEDEISSENWIEDTNFYKATISNSNVQSTDTVIIDLVIDDFTMADELEKEYAKIKQVNTENGNVILQASESLDEDITVSFLVVKGGA